MPQGPNPDRSVDEAFGRVLRRLREARGLSQERLGNDAESGRTFVSELERAKRGASLKTLFRLAPLLETRPSEIVAMVEAELASARRPRQRTHTTGS